MFDVCQIVTILSKNVEDENYWRGKVGGRVGLFPHCFVAKEKYRALYDFLAEDEDELTMKKGEVRRGL